MPIFYPTFHLVNAGLRNILWIESISFEEKQAEDCKQNKVRGSPALKDISM